MVERPAVERPAVERPAVERPAVETTVVELGGVPVAVIGLPPRGVAKGPPGWPQVSSRDLARDPVPPEATGYSRSRVLRCPNRHVRYDA